MYVFIVFNEYDEIENIFLDEKKVDNYCIELEKQSVSNIYYYKKYEVEE